jgi:LuxR family maltose regulon positive regulatory protein
VLRSKLRPPRARPDRIERPRLFARLDDGLAGPFTLVSAPAGYGKTTLLSQWIERQELPAVWLSLEEDDNEALLFLEALIAAFRTVRPDCCHRAAALLVNSPLPPADIMARELSNDMEDLDEFILVLDDFDNVKDQRVLAGLRALILGPPASMHLVISCRADPMLQLGALRGRGLLTELRAADLRFDAGETAEFLDRVFQRRLTETQIGSLLERTEGWIAGLHLAALSLTGRDDVEQGIREFAGSDRYIADYLMEELFGRLDPGLQRYLTATSILDELSAPLCSALLGDDNLTSIEGRPPLEWLEDSNLFVIALDEQRDWFRYHHLFRELLRHKLYTTSPREDVKIFHERAGEWLSSADRVDEALEHFLKAKRPDLAADIIEAHRVATIDRESWRVLANWSAKLDPAMLHARPALVLGYAWLAHERADWLDVSRYCDRAEQLLDLAPDGDGHVSGLRAEISVLRAQVSYWRGEPAQTLLYARRGLEGLPAEHHYARSVATIFEAGALQMLGDPEGAFEVFAETSRADYGAQADARISVGACVVGFVSGEVDRPRREAERLLDRAIHMGLETTTAWAHMLLGIAAYLRGEATVAESHFEAVRPYYSSLATAKESFYRLAWLRRSRGDIDGALELLDRLASIAADLNVPLEPEIGLLSARLAALSGRPVADLGPARRVLGLLHAGSPILDACFESKPVSALALLVQSGNADDIEPCERAAAQLIETAEAQYNRYREIQCRSLRALLSDRQGRRAEALASLARAVDLAAPGRMVGLFLEMADPLRPLLIALRASPQADPFVDEILSSFPAGNFGQPGYAEARLSDEDHDYSTELLLTNRELDVLELLEQRLSNKEIAKQLVISPATVKRHTLSIYGKLGVGGRREAVAKARHLGLLVAAR